MKRFFLCVGLTLTALASLHAESVYDRVMKSGTIRAEYVIYAPGVIKDPNTGKLSGIIIETLNKVAENLQLKVDYVEEVPIGSMIEGLMGNRYDIALYFWPSAARARACDFTIPIFYNTINGYARPDDHRFDKGFEAGMKDPSVRISAIDGELTALIAKSDFPNTKIVPLPQSADFSQSFLMISTGKADVYFGDPSAAALFLKNNPGKVKNVTPGKPIRTFGNTIMFKRGEMEFKNMLDRALEELINSGFVDQLIKKYEPAPQVIFPAALPYRPLP